ncbi:hypothetical protein VT84_25820 [Gemmata sp. SH-PL17]|nr:hypothetical protein VT84_25820 [Gemmata sp. SH-PL17]
MRTADAPRGVVSLLKRTETKGSIQARRVKAGWDDDSGFFKELLSKIVREPGIRLTLVLMQIQRRPFNL